MDRPHRDAARVRVILADDHAIVRRTVAIFVAAAGFQVVGEASDGREAVGLARHLQPDVAVLDLVMPGLNGLEATREIALASPRTASILLTGRRDAALIPEGLRAGIRGYVPKRGPADELIRAIHEVAAGGVYLGVPERRRAPRASRDALRRLRSAP